MEYASRMEYSARLSKSPFYSVLSIKRRRCAMDSTASWTPSSTIDQIVLPRSRRSSRRRGSFIFSLATHLDAPKEGSRYCVCGPRRTSTARESDTGWRSPSIFTDGSSDEWTYSPWRRQWLQQQTATGREDYFAMATPMAATAMSHLSMAIGKSHAVASVASLLQGLCRDFSLSQNKYCSCVV